MWKCLPCFSEAPPMSRVLRFASEGCLLCRDASFFLIEACAQGAAACIRVVPPMSTCLLCFSALPPMSRALLFASARLTSMKKHLFFHRSLCPGCLCLRQGGASYVEVPPLFQRCPLLCPGRVSFLQRGASYVEVPPLFQRCAGYVQMVPCGSRNTAVRFQWKRNVFHRHCERLL